MSISGPDNLGANPYPEQTIPYLTFLKATVISALRDAFNQHPDKALAKTQIRLERSVKAVDYPMIVVRYYGRKIYRAGIDNIRYFDDTEIYSIPTYQPFSTFAYEGDVEFVIYALDTLSRDRVVDSLITIIASQNLESWVDAFYNRVYDISNLSIPASDYNWLTFNTDEITPFGASDQQTPWDSENELLYKDAYRTNILGQFLSLPSNDPALTYINQILLYPVDEAVTADDNPSEIVITAES